MTARPADPAMRAPSRAWMPSFEANAYQGFLAGVKAYWGGELYREVVDRAQAKPAADADGLEASMRADAAYRLYAWLERRVQQFKWSGRYGFSTMIDAQRERLAPHLQAATSSDAHKLRLDAQVALPDYIRETETHQQPGGLWREPTNAFALAWYTTGLSFAGTDPDELVDWYARRVAERCREIGLDPRCVADVGCTAGRSTRALKRALPNAEAIGVEICEGPLRQGRLRAIEEGADIALVQASAEDLETALAPRSADVVASHWLWHEMPPRAIRRAIASAHRVLRPGGLFVAYDMMSAPGGVVGRWLHEGYAARNNEPFAATLLDFDFHGALAGAGFTDIQCRFTMPQHPGPDAPAGLPARRLHYMAFVTARLA